MEYNTIYKYKNIVIYYPVTAASDNILYSAFSNIQCNLFFPRNRKIQYSLLDFNSFNLLCDLHNKDNILDICNRIGLPTHIDYEQLIKDKDINCGFLEGINFIYYIYKFNYDIIKIDLPERHLHPNVTPVLLKLISENCKKLIIYTYSSQLYNLYHLL